MGGEISKEQMAREMADLQAREAALHQNAHQAQQQLRKASEPAIRRECVTVEYKDMNCPRLLVRGDLKRFIDPALRVLVLIDTRTKDEHMIPLKRIKYMKVEEITVI